MTSFRSLVAPYLQQPEFRYKKVGYCIYCGARRYSDKREHPLGDEHIVPSGLGGKLVLPQASCAACEQITGGFSGIEGVYQRGAAYALRAAFGLAGRRSRRRPTHFPLTRKLASGDYVEHVPVDQYPAVLLHPVLPPPGLLAGREPTDVFPPMHWTGPILLDVESKRFDIRPDFTMPINLDPGGICRMLAKIAYAFALAEKGADILQKAICRMLYLGKTCA